MGGYSGYSRSNNALEAESEGKFPMTRAIKALPMPAKAARALLAAIGPCEWHHTSKRYNRTDYYDAGYAFRVIRRREIFDALAATGYWKRRAEIEAEYADNNDLTRRWDALSEAERSAQIASNLTDDDLEFATLAPYDRALPRAIKALRAATRPQSELKRRHG